MIFLGILIMLLIFFCLCGLASISRQLEVAVKNQIEIIKIIKK